MIDVELQTKQTFTYRYFDASRKKDEWVLDWYIDKDYRDELRATQQYSVNDDRGTVPFRMMKRVWKGQSDYRHQILILFNEYDPRTDMAKNDRDTKKLVLHENTLVDDVRLF